MKKHSNMLTGRIVFVDNTGNVEKALRKLRKKVDAAGTLKDLQDKEAYTPPSVTRLRKNAAAKKRWQKYLKSQELPPKNY